MNNFYKIITFLSISAFFAFIAMKLESTFVDKFSENILALLTTLFAINIASSTLIAGKVREIQNLTGHPFTKTKKNLKTSFYEQIIFICVAFVASLLKDTILLKNLINTQYLNLACDTLLFLSFIYYLDIIRDIGHALFDLLDFNNKD